jgi:hypothetical protein
MIEEMPVGGRGWASFCLTKGEQNGKVENSLQTEKVVRGTVFENKQLANSTWQLAKANPAQPYAN